MVVERLVVSPDVADAEWAANKGLFISDCSEAMHRIKMRAAAADGDSAGVQRAYQHAKRCAESLGAWTELDPETEEVLASALRLAN